MNPFVFVVVFVIGGLVACFVAAIGSDIKASFRRVR